MSRDLAHKATAAAARPLALVVFERCRYHGRYGVPLAVLLILIVCVAHLFFWAQFSSRPRPPGASVKQVASPSVVTRQSKSPLLAFVNAHVSSFFSEQQQQRLHVTTADAAAADAAAGAAAEEQWIAAAAAASEPSSGSTGMGDRPGESTRKATDSRGRKLVVHFWNTFWGDSFEVFLKTGLPLNARCSRLCELAYDRGRLLDADVVIFHAPELRWQQLPNERKANQLWVLFTLEAPIHGYVSSAHDGVFNLTMTYRSDSDIESGYGHAEAIVLEATSDNSSAPAVPALLQPFLSAADFAERKPYAYWMASRCGNPRMAYVRELAKHIQIDIYGGCGPQGLRTCTSSHNLTVETDCEATLSAKYSFYLAFENSLCPDYVTEKLWRTLASHGGAIPVVLGAPASRYRQVVPPDSYVQADSFPSPRDLAEYLKRVASNHDLFASYHRWRMSYRAYFGWFTEFKLGLCRLCELAYDGVWRERPAKADLSTWFSSGCRGQWPHEKL